MPKFPGTNVEINGTYHKALREVNQRSDPPPPGAIVVKGHNWKFTGSVAVALAVAGWFFGTNANKDYETRRVYRELEREAALNQTFRRDVAERLDAIETKSQREGQDLHNELTILREQMRQVEKALRER